jgi:hypothetical protein
MIEQAQTPGSKPPLPALTLEDLDSLKDVRTAPVEVPEWKRTVYLRSLPADEGLELGEKMETLADDQKTEAIFILLSEVLSTPEGDKLFADPDEAAARARARAWLGKRDIDVLQRLKNEAFKLLGWREQVKEARKNVSGEAALVASPIASPCDSGI